MGNFETPAVTWISSKRLQQFRLLSIIILLPMMIVPIYLNDLSYLYRYLTQWSIEITTISIILSYFAAKYPTKIKLDRIAVIFLEIAIFLNIGTMIAFWTSFARVYFCCIETYWIVALSISHIVPQLIILTNLFLSNTKINLKDGIFGAIVGLTYLLIDYTLSEILNNPNTYEFLHWGTTSALGNSGFFIIGSYLFYVVIWKINESFKNEIDIHL